jgi:excisionase family DNA binding protein
MNFDSQSGAEPLFLTIEYVADYLGLSVATIRRAIHDKKLPAHKFGRAVRVSRSDLDNFITKSRG